MEPHKRDSSELDRILKHEEERKQHWHWDQCRQTTSKRCKGTRSSILIYLHYLFTLFFRFVFVLLLNFSQFRLNLLHFHAGAHCTLVERPKRDTDQNTKDYQNPPIAQSQYLMHP